jgi:hypothetical protein
MFISAEFFVFFYWSNENKMDRDFALRQNHAYHNPGITNIFDAVYNQKNKPTQPHIQGMYSSFVSEFAPAIVKQVPTPRQFVQGQRPYVDWNSYKSQVPGPHREKSSYFHPMTVADTFDIKSEPAPYNPEMPQSHMLFRD